MIRLYSFGPPSVVARDGTPLEELSRQSKRLGLFVYLATAERRFFRRDELLHVFWPGADERSARNCLRQSLHVLRSHLGPGVLLGEGRQRVGLAADRVETDVGDFTRALVAGRAREALALHRDEFLRGFHLPGLPSFERWAAERRRSLLNLAVSAARKLARTAESTADAACAHRVLARLEPGLEAEWRPDRSQEA